MVVHRDLSRQKCRLNGCSAQLALRRTEHELGMELSRSAALRSTTQWSGNPALPAGLRCAAPLGWETTRPAGRPQVGVPLISRSVRRSNLQAGYETIQTTIPQTIPFHNLAALLLYSGRPAALRSRSPLGTLLRLLHLATSLQKSFPASSRHHARHIRRETVGY